MNKTFLIFLMIGTAMMIAVIGQQEPETTLDYQPWDVDRLESGASRVFGITLGKTTVQQANQIFANFAKTQLIVDENRHYELIASYENLVISGIVATLKLQYALEQNTLNEIYSEAMASKKENSLASGATSISLSQETEMSYLSTPVSQITYIPAIDFGYDLTLQYFGVAASETNISDNEKLLTYPALGLQVYIHNEQNDRYVYSPIK